MPNLKEFPTGRELLEELGGIHALEEHIGIHIHPGYRARIRWHPN